MLDLDVLAGVVAFSSFLPVLILQLMSAHAAGSSASSAYALELSVNSKLQNVTALALAGNVTEEALNNTLHALFGQDYAVLPLNSAMPGNTVASRVLCICGRELRVVITRD